MTTATSMTGYVPVGGSDDGAGGDERPNPLVPGYLLDPAPPGMSLSDVYPGGGDSGMEEELG